jgi:ferredoxin
VFTNSEKILKLRGMVLALLRARAPESREIAQLCRRFDVPDYERMTTAGADHLCILCGLCVKACESLGTGAISTVLRGVDKKVSTPFDDVSLVCVGCGSCAAVCPTGAIKIEENADSRTIWNKSLP